MPAVLGGYELLQRIAVGGMAEVFLARKAGPEGFEKQVAIKRILPHLGAEIDFVTMFLDEARLAARLDHPNIVHIHDFGSDSETYYLAMEYVEGQDVQAIIRRANGLGILVSPRDAATLLLGACEALEYAHEQGVIHRDVTPANLLVTYHGVLKLADFGIAKAETQTSHTQAGALKGKIPYMSPEQANGRPLDRRTDVFSLGICAWEFLTGQRLFLRDTELGMLAAVKECLVPSVSSVRPDVPAALAAAVDRALRKAPEDRWPTARAFGQAVADWLTQARVTPSAARVSDYMSRLFGDSESRRAALAWTAESTEAALAPEGAASTPGAPPFLRRSLKSHLRRTSELAWRLSRPPLAWPRSRLFLPVCALLLSGGGLIFALRSPHAHLTLIPNLPPALSASPAPAPPQPQLEPATSDPDAPAATLLQQQSRPLPSPVPRWKRPVESLRHKLRARARP